MIIDSDNNLFLCDAQTGEIQKTIPFSRSSIRNFSVSSSGNQVFYDDGEISFDLADRWRDHFNATSFERTYEKEMPQESLRLLKEHVSRRIRACTKELKPFVPHSRVTEPQAIQDFQAPLQRR